MPCPTNSLLELCFVRVILSATREVRRLSRDPRSANTKAASRTTTMVSALNSGKTKEGSPVGISPKIGAPEIKRLNTVPIISAARGGGTIFASFVGQLKTINNVKRPKPKATQLGSKTALGIAVSAGMVPLPKGSCPKRRLVCKAIIMHPIPLMNPETTGYGTSLMYCPSFKTPKAT